MKLSYKAQLKNPLWQKKRLYIMERDQFQCQCCFSKDKMLTVHHKYYINNKLAWQHPDDVLITLCEDCHTRLHDIAPKTQDEWREFCVFECIDMTFTDYYIMVERFYQMNEQSGSVWVKNLLDFLTSQVITKDQI